MNSIIIDASLNQNRVALVEDDDLVEFYIETSYDNGLVGNIYKGKVENVLKGMQAAFIDIGHDKNAFLYVKEALPFEEDSGSDITTHPSQNIHIEHILKKGKEVIVQVIKDPIGTKGPRVTTHITLPGKFLVLMPTVNYVGISRRIEQHGERERLKNIINDIKPEDMGVIVRTACEGLSQEEIYNDLNFLVNMWDMINRRARTCKVPDIIHRDLNLVDRTIRDLFSQEIDNVIINNEEEYTRVLKLVEQISPHLKSRIKFHDNGIDVFDVYNIESKIVKALSKKVWLKSGGYIVIDETEALTVIDVNTGKFVGNYSLEDTVLKTNIEACYEIAKQIRLRDIGGIIIIDFIDMKNPHNNSVIIDNLKNALKKDKTKTTVLGMTYLGLVEMTRKKVRQKLSSLLQDTCTICKGSGKLISHQEVCNRIERQLIKILHHTSTKNIEIELSNDIYNHICTTKAIDVEYYSSDWNRTISLSQKSEMEYDQFNVIPRP